MKTRVSTFTKTFSLPKLVGYKLLADDCWSLKQDAKAAKHRRKSMKIPFVHD